MKIIIDAENATAGRVGSFAAKELLKGNEVDIINSEKAIISGNKKQIVEKIRKKRKMGSGGSLKGPKISKIPERLLKRIVRGMLPWDKSKGRTAFKKLKCYFGNPLNKKETKKIRDAEIRGNFKYLTIKQVSERL